MPVPIHRLFSAVCMAFACICVQAADTLPPQVMGALAAQGLPSSALGFQVLPVSGAAPRHEAQAERALIPRRT